MQPLTFSIWPQHVVESFVFDLGLEKRKSPLVQCVIICGAISRVQLAVCLHPPVDLLALIPSESRDPAERPLKQSGKEKKSAKPAADVS